MIAVRRGPGPVETYAAILAELDEKARNAARRNKPTMWAYYVSVRRLLSRWFRGEASDEAYVEAAQLVVAWADGLANHPRFPEVDPQRVALAWAAAVYARRVLRAAGVVATRPSLAWLRERAA